MKSLGRKRILAQPHQEHVEPVWKGRQSTDASRIDASSGVRRTICECTVDENLLLGHVNSLMVERRRRMRQIGSSRHTQVAESSAYNRCITHPLHGSPSCALQPSSSASQIPLINFRAAESLVNAHCCDCIACRNRHRLRPCQKAGMNYIWIDVEGIVIYRSEGIYKSVLTHRDVKHALIHLNPQDQGADLLPSSSSACHASGFTHDALSISVLLWASPSQISHSCTLADKMHKSQKGV